jgi:hypothetical protein
VESTDVSTADDSFPLWVFRLIKHLIVETPAPSVMRRPAEALDAIGGGWPSEIAPQFDAAHVINNNSPRRTPSAVASRSSLQRWVPSACFDASNIAPIDVEFAEESFRIDRERARAEPATESHHDSTNT